MYLETNGFQRSYGGKHPLNVRIVNPGKHLQLIP